MAADGHVARLRAFVGAYQLAEPAAILPELARCRLVEAERISRIADGPAGMADLVEHVARQLRWLDGVTPELASALTARA